MPVIERLLAVLAARRRNALARVALAGALATILGGCLTATKSELTDEDSSVVRSFGFTGDPRLVPRESLVTYAQRLPYDTIPGLGDQQRLMLDPPCPGTCRYGPLALIEPVVGTPAPDIVTGRMYLIARLVNKDTIPYPKLGMPASGTAYWFVYRTDAGELRARIVAAPTASPMLDGPVDLEIHDRRFTRMTARWHWSDDDEGGWGSCVRNGCCTVKRANPF
jgi:hypothetical protein